MGVRAYDKAIRDGLFVVIKYDCWWAKSHTRSDINSKTGGGEPESGERADRSQRRKVPAGQLAIHKRSCRHFHSSREPISSD
jgi:hypothetical protein